MERHHQNLHISHHWHFNEILKSRYNDLLVADTLRLLALSMVSLFVPIFLLEKGYSIFQICFFELFLFISSLLIHFFIIQKISILGVKKTMITSYGFNIIFYLFLFYSDVLIGDFGRIFFLLMIAVLDSLALSFYWTSHHVYFLDVTEAENNGQKLGLLLAIPSLIGVFAPFVGGVLITNIGFKGIFLISVILLVLASYVLFFSRMIKVKVDLKMNDVFDFKNIRKNLIYVIQGSVYVATGFIWPLLLFYMSLKLISMGMLYLFSNSIYSLVSYLGGKKSDEKGSSRKISCFGSIGQGLSLIFRALSNTIFFMTAFQAMGGFFGGLLHVSLDSCFFKHSHKNIGSAIMNRELYMYIGRIFMIFLFLAALYSFEVIKALIFVLLISGALLFLLNLLIKKDYSLFD